MTDSLPRNQIMSPAGFKLAMEEIRDTFRGDTEVAHSRADFLCGEMLIALGYAKGVEVFDAMDK